MCELLCKGIEMTRSNSATGEIVKLIVKHIEVTQQAKPNSQFPLQKVFLHYPISSYTFLALHLSEHQLYATGLKHNPKPASKN